MYMIYQYLQIVHIYQNIRPPPKTPCEDPSLEDRSVLKGFLGIIIRQAY